MHYMTTFTSTQACCTLPIGVRLHCMLGCPMRISSNGDGRSEKQRMDEDWPSHANVWMAYIHTIAAKVIWPALIRLGCAEDKYHTYNIVNSTANTWFCWCVYSWFDTWSYNMTHNWWPRHGIIAMSNNGYMSPCQGWSYLANPNSSQLCRGQLTDNYLGQADKPFC